MILSCYLAVHLDTVLEDAESEEILFLAFSFTLIQFGGRMQKLLHLVFLICVRFSKQIAEKNSYEILKFLMLSREIPTHNNNLNQYK